MITARQGFTLLEILVAIGLTAVISLIAFQIFRQVHLTQERAGPARHRDHTARVFLDRFERELMGATLVVKPEETERQSFPWLFLGEDRISAGSDVDALFFVTQNPVRTPGSRAPGLRSVTYAAADAGDGERLDLFRSERRLGNTLVKEIRLDEAEPVLEDVARFSLTFYGEGEPVQGWDSTAPATLDALPFGVAVALQLFEPGPDGAPAPGREHLREIDLPIRPFERAEPPVEPGTCPTGPTIEECIAEYREDLAESTQGGFVTRRVLAAGAGCWHDPEASEELQALHKSFQDVLKIDPAEACLP